MSRREGCERGGQDGGGRGHLAGGVGECGMNKRTTIGPGLIGRCIVRGLVVCRAGLGQAVDDGGAQGARLTNG